MSEEKSSFLKWIAYIIIAIIIGILIYLAFLKPSPDVQAIMKKHEKEKADFESKIKAHEAEEKRLKEEMEWQDSIIDKAQEASDQAERERAEWEKKYKEIEEPVDPGTIKTLEEARKKYASLAKGYGICQKHVEKTKKALNACHHLNKANLAQYKNLQRLYAGEISKSADKSKQITDLNLTIKNLSKAKKPKLWKYITAFLAGGLVIAILK